MPFTPDSLFHSCLVVTDITAAKAMLGKALGLSWSPTTTTPVVVSRRGGELEEVALTWTFSVQAPALELLEAQPGTLWAPHSGTHHLGYWSEDPVGDAHDLVECGFTLELTSFPEQAAGLEMGSVAPIATYASDPSTGLMVELVNTSMRDAV